jgi:hypothetical protein
MQKNYPTLYNQQNYSKIPDDLLGFSLTETIAMGGCFVTSFAMKACFYGVSVDPPSLNQLFKNKNIYISVSGGDKDLLGDNALSLVYSQMSYLKTIDYEPIPTDLSNIQALLTDPATTLTLRINLGSGNYHFVEAVSCDGSTLHIANPLTGAIEDFAKNYGNPITARLHVLIYVGPVVATISPPAASQTPSALATSFNNAITMANNFKTLAVGLGITPEAQVTTTCGQQILDMVNLLEANLKQAQEQNAELQTTIHDLQVATPTPATISAQVPSFTNGSQAISSTPTIPVVVNGSTTAQASTSSLLLRIWQQIVFWLG